MTNRSEGTIYSDKTTYFELFARPGRIPKTGVEKSVKVKEASRLSQRFCRDLWDFGIGPPRCKKSADFEPSGASRGTLLTMLYGSAGNIRNPSRERNTGALLVRKAKNRASPDSRIHPALKALVRGRPFAPPLIPWIPRKPSVWLHLLIHPGSSVVSRHLVGDTMPQTRSQRRAMPRRVR